MAEEILLALKNAEYNNEQRRLLRNQRSRKQTVVNLADGFVPYIISKNENLVDSGLSNHEILSSSEPIHAYDGNDDIDFNLFLAEDCVDNNESDDLENDQVEFDDNMILLDELFSSKVEQDFLPLHPYTNISANEFCKNLIHTFRQANLCKTYSSNMLKLIHLALPEPNTLPRSINSILKFIQVENLFIKRKVCLLCQFDIAYTATSCNKCKSTDTTQIVEIYDIDCERVFVDIVERHLIDIIKYRERIFYDKMDNINNDIPFQNIYRSFLKTNIRQPFISNLIHLDGIALSKSSKLTLWILSCSILELPPHIRNQRKNMIILSIWISDRYPIIEIWLRECIKSLKKLKSTGFSINGGQKWFLYFIGIIADCPAMKLALNHIGNNGYFSCWLCKIEGVHIDNKRQYYFEEEPKIRSIKSYVNESIEAEINGENVNGHLGVSVFHELLDVPLPKSIMIDYMHVTLLRHTRGVVLQLYNSLKPKQRLEIDDKLRYQCFPHTYNRKLKPISAGHTKATEIRNLLLYALVPLFYSYLSVDKAAHIALFVCAIRMLHGQNYFGDRTSSLAHRLISIYYKDHHKYYDALENLVLHLHIHYAMQYCNFGSLNNTNCFAQENLLGSFAKNKHGTRHWGDLLVHYFNIDFALQKQNDQQNLDNVKRIDGAFDVSTISMSNVKEISLWHEHVCGCNQTITCITIYYRCIIRSQVYHCINYPKRQSTNSYFVRYIMDGHDSLFGSITYFFTHKGSTFALIHNYSHLQLFSDIFVSSVYHSLLLKCINSYFDILQANGSSFHYVPIQKILNRCIVFHKNNFIIVTPISEAYEHD